MSFCRAGKPLCRWAGPWPRGLPSPSSGEHASAGHQWRARGLRWRPRRRGREPCMRTAPGQPCRWRRARSRRLWWPGERARWRVARRIGSSSRSAQDARPQPQQQPLQNHPWQALQEPRSGCRPRPGAGAWSGLPCGERLQGSCRWRRRDEAGTRSLPQESTCLGQPTRCAHRFARSGGAPSRPGRGSNASAHDPRQTNLRQTGCPPGPDGGRGSARLSA